MIKVSAILLNYNSSQDCEKCVGYLKNQKYDNLEIIIVDNASNDSEEEIRLNKLCSEESIKVIFNKTNLGYAAGNNIGLRAAVQNGAEWCLIINPDVELRDRNYISHMVDKISEYSDVAVAASSVVMPDGELQNPQRESTFFYDFLWPLQYLKKKEENSNWNVDKQVTGFCDKISGCCLFIKSDFLKEINFLDETTFLYCEEAILSKQVLNANKKILYVHDCVANHEHIKQDKSSPKGRMKIFLRSRRYYIRKYSGYGRIKKALALFSNKVEETIWCFKRK